MTLSRTPLFDAHVSLGAKMVPFAGWEMPVQYSGIIEEHRAVRQAVGLFDVSHMGEFWVTGPESEALLQKVTCNDVSRLANGMAQYTALTNERGGIVDDLIIYRFAPDRFFLCVNASNTAKDFDWITKHNTFNAVVENVSESFGQIAVQGPKARELLLAEPTFADAVAIKPFRFAEVEFLGAPLIVARTGYTGEDGVEIFCPHEVTVKLWGWLLEQGADWGVKPCGLGARDSLRLEACLPLHGHELTDDITVIESGLQWIVRLEKGDFIGREVIEREVRNGSNRRLVGLEIRDRGIARQGDTVADESGTRHIGDVTSGTRTPWLEKAVALALVEKGFESVGQELQVKVRERALKAVVVPTPFYKRNTKKG